MFTPSPLQEIKDKKLDAGSLKLFIKREDLLEIVPNNPHISGNKWRKLKYNLQQAKAENHDTLFTFGGAYSNHIHATAAVGKAFNLKTIGMIRGEETLPLNPTLQFAKTQGMQLHYVDRQMYRQKNDNAFIEKLKEKFGRFYLLPEGGTNFLALKGCAEMVDEITIPFDYICCACGTGGTLSGIVLGLEAPQKAMGFAALKGNFLMKEVQRLLQNNTATNWHIQSDYHFGGYAKHTPTLLDFMRDFQEKHGIVLEPLYTGKMLYGIFDLIEKQYFPKGSTIVAIHTGGLQGLAGFWERFGG